MAKKENTKFSFISKQEKLCFFSDRFSSHSSRERKRKTVSHQPSQAIMEYVLKQAPIIIIIIIIIKFEFTLMLFWYFNRISFSAHGPIRIENGNRPLLLQFSVCASANAGARPECVCVCSNSFRQHDYSL